MTKITNELLEDYAMLYPRIKCLKLDSCAPKKNVFEYIRILNNWPDTNIEHLQLRSIESITDEEAVKLASILFPKVKDWQIPNKNNGVTWVDANDDSENYVAISKEGIEAQVLESTLPSELFIIHQAFQYLQSIGIAVNTIDKEANMITVDELVESGKLKLI